MALTPEQIKVRIVSSLIPKYRADLTWSSLVSAVAGSDEQGKTDLVAALKSGNSLSAGRRLDKIINNWIREQAGTEADGMLADGSLTLAELDRIYG